MVCTDLVQGSLLALCPSTSGLPWGHLEVRHQHTHHTQAHTLYTYITLIVPGLVCLGQEILRGVYGSVFGKTKLSS